MRFDTLWRDARLATLAGPGLGVVEKGTVGTVDGRIVFAGPESELPTGATAAREIRLDGRWITPGLIDCHTHLVFGGDRAHEFELRLNGASYEEIARAGATAIIQPGGSMRDPEVIAAADAAGMAMVATGMRHFRH